MRRSHRSRSVRDFRPPRTAKTSPGQRTPRRRNKRRRFVRGSFAAAASFAAPKRRASPRLGARVRRLELYARALEVLRRELGVVSATARLSPARGRSPAAGAHPPARRTRAGREAGTALGPRSTSARPGPPRGPDVVGVLRGRRATRKCSDDILEQLERRGEVLEQEGHDVARRRSARLIVHGVPAFAGRRRRRFGDDRRRGSASRRRLRRRARRATAVHALSGSRASGGEPRLERTKRVFIVFRSSFRV